MYIHILLFSFTFTGVFTGFWKETWTDELYALSTITSTSLSVIPLKLMWSMRFTASVISTMTLDLDPTLRLMCTEVLKGLVCLILMSLPTGLLWPMWIELLWGLSWLNIDRWTLVINANLCKKLKSYIELVINSIKLVSWDEKQDQKDL